MRLELGDVDRPLDKSVESFDPVRFWSIIG
jgi:hypothetical protein